jgi:ssDNA-binding Zn-finger/Zn-ribbon topoisomerase 1
MSVFWMVISAISTISGNFITRCPKCSAKMRREERHDQAYERTVRGRGASSYALRTGTTRYTGKDVKVVPVFDICPECGHQVRRRNLEFG